MLPLNSQRFLQERRPADSSQATLFLPPFCHRTILAHHLAVMAEVDGDVKTCQRDAADNLIDMTKLGLLGAHKLASGGRVVEQIQHFQRGADRVCRGFNRDVHVAPFSIGLPGFLLFSGAGGERQTGNGTDTGQRLTAKAEADDCFQIVKRGNFTGRMTRQR